MHSESIEEDGLEHNYFFTKLVYFASNSVNINSMSIVLTLSSSISNILKCKRKSSHHILFLKTAIASSMCELNKKTLASNDKKDLHS